MTIGRTTLSAVLLLAATTTAGTAAATAPAAGAAPAGAAPGPAAARHHRNLCNPPADSVAPTITKVVFGRSTIDLDHGSRTQVVHVYASDASDAGAPSGVKRVDLEIHGNRFYSGVRLTLTAGTPADGTWSGRFTVSKYAHPGTYAIDYLSVIDAARNEQDYPTYGSVPQGPDDLSLHPADNPTFTVTGTPATRPPGTPAGTLRDLSLTPSTVDTTAAPRHVHVTARFTGPQPSTVYVTLTHLTKARGARFVYLTRKLARSGAQWLGAVRIPRWLGDQKLDAQLEASWSRHFRPRNRSYDADRLRQLHLDSSVTVTSGVDRSKPKLTSVRFSHATIDSTTGPATVTVTAHATDVGSGVRAIRITGGIHHGINGVAGGDYPFAASGVGFLSDDDFSVRLHRGTDGGWVGTTTVPKCVPSGTYKLQAEVRDGADNDHFYSTRQLAKAGVTSTVDVTSQHGDIVSPYVYSAATYGAEKSLFLNFSEGVANVDTSTLTVFPLAPRSTRYTHTAAISNIVCANGSDVVDCSGSGGLVTSAKLTVPGLQPGRQYTVYANLHQTAPQLVDGNGNAMDWNGQATEVKDS